MTIAIDYTIGKNPDTLQVVFGMQVAIFNWLKAFFCYGTQERIVFLIDDPKAWHEVQALAEETGLDPQRLVAYDRRFVQQNYGGITTVFRCDPLAQDMLWRRETVPGPGYAFCGLAHAISGLETGSLLEQYCLAPTDRSDAIICPSRAVQAAIRSFLDQYSDYICRRYNASYRCDIQLPVMPLGIDIEKFVAKGDPAKRGGQRAALGVADDEFVLLWVGRLSHAIKAHPLAMFQAAEQAAIASAKTGGKRVHFVLQGYFVPESVEPHFRTLAADICHTAKVTFVPNLDPRFPDGIWAAGDAFFSLIDNMQESFGLTPIEAMAAGLPRIVSDWDGYRDGVEHGVDGFLVPTYQPPPGSGQALADLLLSGRDQYGGYLSKTSLSTAIDQAVATQHILTLMQNDGLRHSMAAKAKARAYAQYDWRHIIPRYEAFWAESGAQRQRDHANKPRIPWASLPPQAPDPYTMYAAYPTAPFVASGKLRVTASAATIKQLMQHEINVYGLDMLIPPDDALALVQQIAASGEITIGDVFRANSAQDPAALWRTVGWLVKLGILHYKIP